MITLSDFHFIVIYWLIVYYIIISQRVLYNERIIVLLVKDNSFHKSFTSFDVTALMSTTLLAG